MATNISIDRQMTATEVQGGVRLSQDMVAAVQPTIAKGQFTFFAAFDGTNNDRGNVPLSENPKSTNVDQLYLQVDALTQAGYGNTVAKYYSGVGTHSANPITDSTWIMPFVKDQVIATAENAYKEFQIEASNWLEANPGGTVTAAMTAFSRGGGSGNDTLRGEAGNDTFLFRRGSGIDRIKDWNAGDRVWLAVASDEARFKRSRNDLVIGFADTFDKLVIENYYLKTPGSQTVIAFRDGSAWSDAELTAWMASPANASDGNDMLNGTAQAETLQGLGGNYAIAGNGGWVRKVGAGGTAVDGKWRAVA